MLNGMSHLLALNDRPRCLKPSLRQARHPFSNTSRTKTAKELTLCERCLWPMVAANADVRRRIRTGAKVCSGVIIILVVIAALGPVEWAPRTVLVDQI